MNTSVRLEIGKAGDVVEVEAQAVAVDTTRQTLDTVIQSKEIKDLPLFSRNFLDLAAMAPGVSAALITTVTGLLVAIPAMFGYNYLVTTIRATIVELDNFAAELGSEFEHKFVEHGASEPRRESHDRARFRRDVPSNCELHQVAILRLSTYASALVARTAFPRAHRLWCHALNSGM